ncbi:hypothetical protein FBUS_10670 [Fasciolopsis buskii]|uniref:Uncharacterized protein n=1 Tax=Fasciolopsis buskii TaxID=27845 RepID=A0A8E0S3P8_9TREM|nr:hypothetical protein FBUS_10670 [Fasciolopsis buski]
MEPVSVRCNIFSFSNPFSDEVEYVVCTSTSIKSLQTTASVAATNVTSSSHKNSIPLGDLVQSSSCPQPLDFDHDPISGHSRSGGPLRESSNVASSASYGSAIRSLGDSQSLSYWRSAIDGPDQFNAFTNIQSGFRSLSNQAQLLSGFRMHQAGSNDRQHVTTEIDPAHVKLDHDDHSVLSVQLNSHEANRAQFPGINGTFGSATHSNAGEYQANSSTYVSTPAGSAPDSSSFELIPQQTLSEQDVCSAAYYSGVHKHGAELPSDSSSSLIHNACVVHASDSGLTRPSAICYLPSAPNQENLRRSSPHIHYPPPSGSLAMQESYHSSADASSASQFYNRSPARETNISSVFHGWYSSDLTHCPTSASASSSTPSEPFQQSGSTDQISGDLGFSYPGHLVHSSVTSIPATPRNSMQPSVLQDQQSTSTYFDYFHCDPVYPTPPIVSTEDYRQLTSVNATPGSS